MVKRLLEEGEHVVILDNLLCVELESIVSDAWHWEVEKGVRV